MGKVILYCRPGFEKECAEEITDKAANKKIFGVACIKHHSGYVIFECYQSNDAHKLVRELPFNSLIFPRQMFISNELLKDLPSEDRITSIISKLKDIIGKDKGGDLRVETADNNECKKLIKFCRKFAVPLRTALRNTRILTNCKTLNKPVIHIFFISFNCCYIGYSFSNNNSPFYMGIPRLSFPKDAPSRSTLKLEEAFHVFIPADDWNKRLADGMYAVDLGACPGGWTYQLVRRNMFVYSVDNGQIAKSLIDTGRVVWLRKNGFHFRPSHNNISWLVCDIVEKPDKVTSLITHWLINGWCCEAIFNLKLPMKKRYETVLKNLAYIQQQLNRHSVFAEIQARHLYHDRKEVTVHVRRQPKHPLFFYKKKK